MHSPMGQRFSGANMDPIPPWLSGAHYIALNMTNVDLPTMLHHALFASAAGYVLKPQEMCDNSEPWPTMRDDLHRATLEILSCHNLPKLRERRPLLSGRREACHAFAPELSGKGVPPDNLGCSSPQICVSYLR